jgi:hypothetical protein
MVKLVNESLMLMKFNNERSERRPSAGTLPIHGSEPWNHEHGTVLNVSVSSFGKNITF